MRGISIKNIITLTPSLTYGLMFSAFFIACYFILDPDFGWHLASGRYILTHGIPEHDIYSYTASTFQWIHHEWLADVVNALLYQAGGYLLLSILYAGMWTYAFYLIARKSNFGIIILLAAFTILPFSGVRAVTWTMLGIALLLELTLRRTPLRLALLPLLFMAWANVHGGFLVGLVYVLWLAITQRQAQYLLAALTAVIATFVNPYLYNLYAEIFRTLFDTDLHNYVAEWSAFVVDPGMSIYIGLWITSLILGSTQSWRAAASFDALLFVSIFKSHRNMPIFTIFSLRRTLNGLQAMFPLQKMSGTLQGCRAVTAILVTVMIAGGLAYGGLTSARIDKESSYPKQIATYIMENPCSGNVFNDYTAGGYLIWKAPNTKFFIDGRMPSWEQNGEKYMRTYMNLQTDTSMRNDVFKRYDIACVIWNKDTKFAVSLQKEGWSQAVADPSGYVLYKKPSRN